MPKGTSLDEATLNSERIKPVALAVIELYLCLSEGISQSVRWLVGRSVSQSVENSTKYIYIFKFCRLGYTNQYCQGAIKVL